MNISRRPLGVLLFISNGLATVPKSKGNEGKDKWGIVLDFRTSIGWFVGVLVGYSWELGLCDVESIGSVMSKRAVSD